MPKKIKIIAGDITALAVLKDTPTAQAVLDALPLTQQVQRWGGEVYFPIEAQAPLEEDCTEVLQTGELGFWPEGKTFCIFTGQTPGSDDEDIRSASAVNVFGNIEGDCDQLKDLEEGTDITLESLEDDAEIEAPEEEALAETEESEEPLDEDEIEDGQEDQDEEYEEEDDLDEEQLDEETIEETDHAEMEEDIDEEPEEQPREQAEQTPEQTLAQQLGIETTHQYLYEPESQRTPEPREIPDDDLDDDRAEYEPSPAEEDEEFYSMTGADDIPETEPAMMSPHKTYQDKPAMPKKFEWTPTNIALVTFAVILLIITAYVSSQLNSISEEITTMKQEIAANAEKILGITSGDSGQKIDAIAKEVENNKIKLESIDIDVLQTKVTGLTNEIGRLKTANTNLQIQLTQIKATAASSDPDVKWITNTQTGHSYCTTPYPMPWHMAKKYAEKIGGYLATIGNEAENEWIVTTFGEATEFWIGLNDELEEGKWTWVNGEPFSYKNWAPGEPDNYRKTQHYVMINSIVPDRGHMEPGKWNDQPSNDIHVAIIERDR